MFKIERHKFSSFGCSAKLYLSIELTSVNKHLTINRIGISIGKKTQLIYYIEINLTIIVLLKRDPLLIVLVVRPSTIHPHH